MKDFVRFQSTHYCLPYKLFPLSTQPKHHIFEKLNLGMVVAEYCAFLVEVFFFSGPV